VRGGLAVVGAIILLAGAVFAGQGLGYIPGSYMSGDIKWFWIGSGMVWRDWPWARWGCSLDPQSRARCFFRAPHPTSLSPEGERVPDHKCYAVLPLSLSQWAWHSTQRVAAGWYFSRASGMRRPQPSQIP